MKKKPAKPKAEESHAIKPVAEAKLAARRQQVLKRARKFVLPLKLNRKKFLILTGGLVVGLVVCALVTLGILVYRLKNDSDLVYRISKVMPYPAARINDQFISYGDYLFELNILKHASQNPAGPAGADMQPVDFSTEGGKKQLVELQNSALETAKQKAIVIQLANENKLEVSDLELDEEVERVVSSQGGKDKVTEVLKLYYGWDLADLREALYPLLLQRKLQPLLSGDKRKTAEDILKRAQAGEDFSAMAKQFSEDPGSKESGGDLGFSSRGAYFKEFEDIAFALQPGAVSSIVETQYGFHIIKSLEVKDDQIRVAHILIKYVDLGAIINQRLGDAKTRVYIKIAPNPKPQPQSQPQPELQPS